MVKYFLQRLLLVIITLFLILTVTFFILQALPGSPFNNDKMTSEQLEIMEEAYGLSEPAYVQYFYYMKGIVTEFDFGVSFKFRNREVSELVIAKVPHTVQVGGLALVFGVPVGLLLGAIAAINRNGAIDAGATILAVLGVSIPSFVLAALMQFYLAYQWDLFPFLYVATNPEKGITMWNHFHSMMMPSLALAIGVISTTMRYMRTELVDVLGSDYILLARAKGLSKTKVINRHAVRNAMVPVITVVGPMTVMLISGSTVIEKFFGVPGLAQTLINAISTRDYFLILGITFVYSAILVIVILLVDLLYGIIDPRIRLSGGDH